MPVKLHVISMHVEHEEEACKDRNKKITTGDVGWIKERFPHRNVNWFTRVSP